MSTRAKILAAILRRSPLLREEITHKNLAAKRRAYARAARLVPVMRAARIEPVLGGVVKGEWISTPKSKPDKVMLYLHGGGFVFGHMGMHRDLIARIANETEMTALSLDYSLAPENPFPTAVNEALAAYEWLLQTHKPENIVFAGDSAGGSLVLSMLHRLQAQKLPNPACAVVIAPPLDATLQHAKDQDDLKKDFFIRWENLEFFINAYFAETPRDHPEASALFGEFTGFPPLLLHVSRDELMHDDVLRVARKARRAGVVVDTYVVDGLWHVWHLFVRYLPEGKAAITNIATFVKKHSLSG